MREEKVFVTKLLEDIQQASLERAKNRDNVHPFMQRLYKHLHIAESLLEDFVASSGKYFSQSLDKRLFPEGVDERIPKLHHRIWITSKDNPHNPPEYYIQDIIRNKRDVGSEWQYMFWTNSESVKSFMAERTQSSGVQISIMSISDLLDDDCYPLIETLTKDEKYVLASDVSRLAILFRFGGLYSDLGVTLSRSVLDLIQISNNVLFLGENNFFQTSVLASCAQSELLSIYRAMILNHHSARCYLGQADTHYDATEEVNLLAGPGFTAIAMLFCPTSDRNLVLSPMDSLIIWSSQGSWYGGEQKFGNVDMSVAEPSFPINIDVINPISQILVYDTLDALSSVKLQLLSSFAPYFKKYKTRLCKIMNFYGSDKARGWHNYAYIYDYFFNPIKNELHSLLEIGIGTNYADAISTMGVSGVPGASLRGWLEYMPHSLVYGADVDRRILFDASQIKTYFVDQTDIKTIDKLYRELPALPSIVIDDGLHEIEANINVITSTIKCASESWQIIIVEDIAAEYMDAWKNFLASFSYQTVLLCIPNEENLRDNNLLIIRNAQRVD